MQITYRNLLNAKSALESLLKISPAPTARLAAQIARNVRLADGLLRDFNTAKELMLKPYRDEKGKLEELAPEVEETLEREYQELLDTDVAIEIHPLRLSDIEKVEQDRPGFEIPTEVFFNALWMFEDDITGPRD